MNPIIFFEQHISHILFVKFSAKSPHLKYLVASYFGTDGRSRRNTMSSCLFGCALKRILTHVPVARWAPADKKSLRHVSAGRVSAEVPRWARTIASPGKMVDYCGRHVCVAAACSGERAGPTWGEELRCVGIQCTRMVVVFCFLFF
jgi:hypothetical protein